MADDPYEVIVDSAPHLVEQYRAYQRNFVPYTEREVANAEADLGVVFPNVYRQYLLQMGKSPGELFTGSQLCKIDELPQSRLQAIKMITYFNEGLTLPKNAVIYMFHQGYVFLYFLADGGIDAPVFEWLETRLEPKQLAASFADLIDAELRLMERVHREIHDSGGYYATLNDRAMVSRQWRPAVSSGYRPLDHPNGPTAP